MSLKNNYIHPSVINDLYRHVVINDTIINTTSLLENPLSSKPIGIAQIFYTYLTSVKSRNTDCIFLGVFTN